MMAMLPPLVVQASEDEIVITDILTNRCVAQVTAKEIVLTDKLTNKRVVIDPKNADFQTRHSMLFGVWAIAFGNQDSNKEGGVK